MLYTYDLHHNFGRASTVEKVNPQLIFTIQTLIRNPYGTDRQTDGRMDGRAWPAMRPIRTAAQ